MFLSRIRKASCSRSAFTLIELLVVIAIIAILAAILFPVFAQAREKARQATCQSQLKQWGLAFMMYAQDYDETFPEFNHPVQYVINGTTYNTTGWIALLQPYVEKLGRVTDRGKDITADANSQTHIGNMHKCPSHVADPRAATDSSGNPRLSSGGATSSYAMSEAFGGTYRTFASLNAPADTILLAEDYLNFTQMVFFPVSWDENIKATYGRGRAESGDCRFDRNTSCGSYPARPEVMPGVNGVFASNLATRHSGGSEFLFSDGHVKHLRPGATFKPDGSFSMWTISNKWFRP